MSKFKKNILIIGLGIAVYLFTAYVNSHVLLFAQPLDKWHQSNSYIVSEFSNILVWLLFTPALRVITILVCMVLLIVVNKKKKDSKRV
ncbi:MULTISPECIES: hypothetical protein [unclassified Enterococcus]|uniref:hypothetical protein n=1 Tax=unclassified Enterococcus TaxID=2608891 RepID=UPI0013EA16C0|nr:MULTISPECIES: hypothetical protein [unclassified Enterococcus]